MGKWEYFVFFINIIFTILWIIFRPQTLKGGTETVYVLLAIPIALIYWELVKKIQKLRKK